MSILKNLKTKVLSVNITKKFFVISFFVVLMVFSVFSSLDKKVQASSTDNVAGWAWSSNIGWISLNCTNTNTCGTSNYGLTIANNGDVTGYAWSSNIGWIKFGGFANSSFPNTTGDGTSPINANLSGSKITGWARACNGLNSVITNPQINQTLPSGTACTGVTRTDGWDGWISLHNSNDDYGVVVDSSTNTITGYAWGSDVIGWIQFNGTTSSLPPSLTLAASATTINSGDIVTLTSSGVSINSTINGTATSTLNTVVSSDWTGAKTCPGTTPVNYSVQLTNPSTTTTAVYTFKLNCTKSTTGTVDSNIITINVNPTPPSTFVLYANGIAREITIHSGDVVKLSSVATPGYLKPADFGVSSDEPNADVNWKYPKGCPQSLSPETTYTPSAWTLTNPSTTVTTTYLYHLTCNTIDTGETLTETVAVNVLPAESVVSLSLKVSANGSTPSVGPITINTGDTITLSSTGSLLNTTANNGLASIDWTGAVTCPSSLTIPLDYAPRTLTNTSTSFANTYSYKITCHKASDGTDVISNTVQVVVSPSAMPTVTLKAYSDPSFINRIITPLPAVGGNVYLQWSSTGATSCVSSNLNIPTNLTYSGWSGATQAVTGSTGAINTTNDTTFEINCSLGGTTVGDSAPVQVGPSGPLPKCPALGTPPCPKRQPGYIEI
ncbi:MAG: hypothetical protein WAV23_03425 [Minisyncoccia bacterium]